MPETTEWRPSHPSRTDCESPEKFSAASRRAAPARIRLPAVDALKLRSLNLLVPHEVTVRQDKPVDVLLGKDQSVLEGCDDAFHIDGGVAAVGMHADPMARRTVWF